MDEVQGVFFSHSQILPPLQKNPKGAVIPPGKGSMASHATPIDVLVYHGAMAMAPY